HGRFRIADVGQGAPRRGQEPDRAARSEERVRARGIERDSLGATEAQGRDEDPQSGAEIAMSAADHSPAVQTEGDVPSIPPVSGGTLALFFAAAVAVCVVGTLVPGTMVPLLAAAGFALAPRKGGAAVRVPFALTAGLMTLFVVRNWPA